MGNNGIVESIVGSSASSRISDKAGKEFGQGRGLGKGPPKKVLREEVRGLSRRVDDILART